MLQSMKQISLPLSHSISKKKLYKLLMLQVIDCNDQLGKINKIIVMKPSFLKRPSILQANNTISELPSNYAIKDLQQSIDPANHLPHRSLCRCTLCLKNGKLLNSNEDVNHLQSTTLNSKKLFKRLLQGLTMSGAKSLKIFIPDLFFVQGDVLEIYQTTRDSRVTKLSGATPIKHMYATMLRMRREYKSQLQQLFNKKMYDKVDPELMHSKYYDICVPSHFHPGVASPFLEGNKNHFRRYVLHNDKRYQIQSLQQHKMNDRQPFCIVVYRDGNSQLLNQVQFQLFALQSHAKIQDQVLYFQSYIKYKKQADSILYSEYSYSPETIDMQLDAKTETEVMITLGAMNKYDEGYNDLESLQEITIELMLNDPKKYVQMMTYKIIHYLAMASRIYVTHLKIKWIINDVGTIYLQEIMQCKITEVPHRIIKYKLPKVDQNADFYSEKSNHFLDMYKDLKKRRVLNTLIIKKDVDSRTYEDLLATMNPEMKEEYDQRKSQEQAQFKQILKLSHVKKKHKVESRLYNTIDVASEQKKLIFPRRLKVSDASTYQQHIKQHPELLMKNMRYDSASLNRYAPEKTQKVDHKINNHFIIHMSTEDKKMISSLNRKNNREQKIKSSLDRYIEQRKEKVEKSLLYSTFHDLNRQNVQKMKNLFGHEKIAQKLLQNSTQ